MQAKYWDKLVDSDLASELNSSAVSVFDNAVLLLEEAVILKEAKRYSRSLALAILAEEEFSKSFILKTSAFQKRWDSVLFDAMRRHSEKQALSEASCEYSKWLRDNIERVMEYDVSSLNLFPPQKFFKDIVEKAKKTIKNPIRDRQKQDCLYVGIDRGGRVKNKPIEIGEGDAKYAIQKAIEIKLFVGLVVGQSSSLKDWLDYGNGH